MDKNTILVIVGVLLGLIALPFGYVGFMAMFLGSEIYQVFIPWAISIVAAVSGIALARKGLHGIKEIEKHKHADFESTGSLMQGIAYIGIGIGIVSFLLLIIYWFSY